MADNVFLVLTVIGKDRPGLVEELAATIAAHQGNWLDASMSQLAGQFAGIVQVAAPVLQVEPLRQALNGLAGLRAMAEPSGSPAASKASESAAMSKPAPMTATMRPDSSFTG